MVDFKSVFAVWMARSGAFLFVPIAYLQLIQDHQFFVYVPSPNRTVEFKCIFHSFLYSLHCKVFLSWKELACHCIFVKVMSSSWRGKSESHNKNQPRQLTRCFRSGWKWNEKPSNLLFLACSYWICSTIAACTNLVEINLSLDYSRKTPFWKWIACNKCNAPHTHIWYVDL